MLRIHLLQIWFNLADKAVGKYIYDSYAMRKFIGLNLSKREDRECGVCEGQTSNLKQAVPAVRQKPYTILVTTTFETGWPETSNQTGRACW
ncbi:MAG: transposase [Spirochaetaceae bacterium]|jgi:hypothetical protein|nr:transposase [Spirochaetaceae bacterium]